MIKKIILYLLIFSNVLALPAQSKQCIQAEIDLAVNDKNWISAFCFISKLLEDPQNRNDELINQYLIIKNNYQNFSDVSILVNSSYYSNIDNPVNITTISFNGTFGDYKRTHLKIVINLAENTIKTSMGKDYTTAYIDTVNDYTFVFNNIIKNCKSQKYGVSLEINDLYGTIEIEYLENNTVTKKYYTIEYGYISDKYMYIGLYFLLYSFNK